MKVRIEHGDCLDVMRRLADEGVQVDSIATDPPYGLGFTGKQWDTPGSFVERKPDRRQRFDHVGGNHNPTSPQDAARTRRVEGQKMQAWCEEWATLALALLKPGGHLVAFGGSRTFHRMICAIEDAGFEVRDGLCWLYGTGFPKSHNIGDGLGTALKPAWEPITLARKPLAEPTVAANVLRHGTGALNIDGCRIEHADAADLAESLSKNPGRSDLVTSGVYGAGRPQQSVNVAGRWPANVCHDGSPEVLEAFEKFGERGGGFGVRGASTRIYGNGKGLTPATGEAVGFGDTGTAARFFYSSKASKADRAGSKHPTVKPVALMRWLVRMVTPPGGTVLDPFAGSGTTGQAAREEGFDAILIERELEYLKDIKRRIALLDAADLFA